MNLKQKISLIFLVLMCTFNVFHAQQSDTLKVNKYKPKLAGIPITNYNRSLGFSIGALGLISYTINKKDSISPRSRAGAVVVGTTNKTWGTVVWTQNYLNEDKWRLNMAAGYFSYNFQFFQTSPVATDQGVFVDYNTAQYFVGVRFFRKIVSKLYLGINMSLSHAQTTFNEDKGIQEPEVWLVPFGLAVQYDSRNDQNYPTKGWNMELYTRTYIDQLGNTNDFNGIDFQVNNFSSLGKKIILASRFRSQLGLGNVPFEAQKKIGNQDIRGYTNGKFRGNSVVDLQTELRYFFLQRWGMVGFVGAASAFNEFNELQWSDVKPGAGIGIRFKMIQKESINVGVDAAWGEDDWGIYFRIREAF